MGISPGEIAIYGFVGQICAFCSRLLVAVLADRTRLHKLVRRRYIYGIIRIQLLTKQTGVQLRLNY